MIDSSRRRSAEVPLPRRALKGRNDSLAHYYNASHLRTDFWDRLKLASQRLRTLASQGADSQEAQREIAEALGFLEPVEFYWAFPGKRFLLELRRLFEAGSYAALARQVALLVRLFVSGDYRRRDLTHRHLRDDDQLEMAGDGERQHGLSDLRTTTRPYFEVLLVDELTPREEIEVRARLLAMRDEQDDFVYDVVVVPSFEDALIAALFNHNIQSCVIRYSFPFDSANHLDVLKQFLAVLDPEELAEALTSGDHAVALAQVLHTLRPELDLFLVTDAPVEDIAARSRRAFRRIFYRQEDYRELHLSILKGISERFETPFFSALIHYSQQPTGVFHAMPISRGKSVEKSHWIGDLKAFYGMNIFMAETSSTAGGLDSLLQPHGPLKSAQGLAARAYGSRRAFFVTNGTSTANKIVVQALVQPGDIILIDRDCHKSHHYGLMLAGAYPIYMDSYPLSSHSMYGAVPLAVILEHLRALKETGKLDRVRMVLLTNCTFDGITYRPEHVMHEILAIKPTMIFLWDEAWFGFATFNPVLRRRTAMEGARRLRALYRSEVYRKRWDEAQESPEGAGEAMPDPDLVRVRVYATQSTHKTLTSLRQGSMIHVFDQDFEEKVYGAFHEAYMTHTSTSPSYQILATLDVGRRQVELEGYEMVQKSIELAMTLRERVRQSPLINRFFKILGPADLIPEEYRPSQLKRYYDRKRGWGRMGEAWLGDEFALDPTRVTVDIGRTGMDGDTFRHLLMDEFDIQINKTSRNSVLFMIHIGTTRGGVAHLVEVLTQIAEQLDERLEEMSPIERQRYEERVRGLTEDLPPLPDFSCFHPVFRPDSEPTTQEGDVRRAFFLAYDSDACEYLPLDGTIQRQIEGGRDLVSAGFVTPYPPGFPILMPGQVVSQEILAYLKALDVKEIHGYRADYGLRVFTEATLAALGNPGSPPPNKPRAQLKAPQTKPNKGV